MKKKQNHQALNFQKMMYLQFIERVFLRIIKLWENSFRQYDLDDADICGNAIGRSRRRQEKIRRHVRKESMKRIDFDWENF